MAPSQAIADLWSDLRIALALLTRLPTGTLEAVDAAAQGRATRLYPLVGALIGGFGGLIYWLAQSIGLPALPAALLALGATILLTGGFHEDGLADTADGFGGGPTRARKLEIMRDSRIGSYGVLALILSLGLRVGALEAIGDAGLVTTALIAAHGVSRACLPLAMMCLPPARSDGLAARIARPGPAQVGPALAIAVILAVALLPLISALWILLIAGLTVVVVLWLTARQIGGVSGDSLGALQQTSEVTVLLTLAALS